VIIFRDFVQYSVQETHKCRHISDMCQNGTVLLQSELSLNIATISHRHRCHIQLLHTTNEVNFHDMSHRLSFTRTSNIYVVSVAECFLDLNFVVDSSASINDKGRRNWDVALQFVANIVRQFTIGPNDVQVAFVLFSHLATVEWGLTQYRDVASLVNAILGVPYIGSTTNLNDALYLTRTRVFAPGRGTRPNAIKVTIILTDGEDNVPAEGTPLTIANATLCKRQGIRLIAIGVSEKVDLARVLQIVSSQTDYHAVDDFDSLTSVIAQLQPEQICFPTPSPPGPGTCNE